MLLPYCRDDIRCAKFAYGLLLLYCLPNKFVHHFIAEDISVLVDRLFKGIADGPLSIQKMIQFASR